MAKKTETKLDFGSKWDYSAAPESASHAEIKKEYELYINGKFVKAEGGKKFASINPSTDEHIAYFAEASDKDVDKAVKAARKAYNEVWSVMPPKERAKYIFRIARLIQERAREFAVLESIDGGKPIRESRDVDVPLAANHFFYYAGWADKLEYAFPGKKAKPVGVAGQIIPWN
ncbi:MAG: aldehyde dehydrogenase family protein, partial [Flavobacteriales bacterium]|nr:aldehyde dehydrogenase family protein [Flavobacteriales bacterium]